METIDDYIEAHISPEPKILADTYRFTNTHHLYPRMCSGHIQGRVLKMLTELINPQRVLELGCYTGYSTLCMAEALKGNAELHTVEIDDELTDELLERFASVDYGKRITLHTGDALEIVPQLGGEWDMVLIDANKRHYPDYYRMLMPMIKQGGYMLADNTLWDGKVASTPPPTDAQSRGIMEFNDMVAADSRVEVSILPLRDGLTLIRKL
ncbi:MAG: O-methyltransferase [Firmicutes bacterium]|nr:O-methyltransferase [Bacillota bacterium]MCM1400578.1 O-methyltransferase [Bacteroides sp.]MCM1476482.1 O-methyltransferase [Bacteroides sp.]